MSGFSKLFASITESSIWTTDDKTLRVWIAFLARSNSTGVVEGSVPGFASLCRMSVKEFCAALEKLTSPDPYSRTPDNEGRRVAVIQGGWQILNYVAYRNRCQSKDDSRAEDMRRFRARKAAGVTPKCNALPPDVTRDLEAEAEAEASSTHAGSQVTRPPDGGNRSESPQDELPGVETPPKAGNASGEAKANAGGSKKFTPPTLEMIRLQCAKIGLPEAEAEKFFGYYEANGWKVGRNPMKSWQGALTHWRGNWVERGGGRNGHSGPMTERDWQ